MDWLCRSTEDVSFIDAARVDEIQEHQLKFGPESAVFLFAIQTDASENIQNSKCAW
jgi:hypothetical protein